MNLSAEKPAALHPPKSYQEWLSLFSLIRDNPQNQTALQLMSAGNLLPLSGKLLDSFLSRMDETIRTLINSRIDRFLRDLKEALETGNLDDAEVCAIRFCSETKNCFFFETLSFLPEAERSALSEGYNQQLQTFWTQLLNTVEQDAQEQCNSALEDMAYMYRRLSGSWRHRREKI